MSSSMKTLVLLAGLTMAASSGVLKWWQTVCDSLSEEAFSCINTIAWYVLIKYSQLMLRGRSSPLHSIAFDLIN